MERALEVDDPAVLLPHLERLWDLLPEHFAYEEEEGGFLDQIGRTSPGGGSHVALLRAEHRRFEAVVPELVDAIKSDQPGVLDRVRDFAHDIREHELLEGLLGGMTR